MEGGCVGEVEVEVACVVEGEVEVGCVGEGEGDPAVHSLTLLKPLQFLPRSCVTGR